MQFFSARIVCQRYVCLELRIISIFELCLMRNNSNHYLTLILHDFVNIVSLMYITWCFICSVLNPYPAETESD